ncbi:MULTISPECIES: alpha/beta hydrolase [Methylobacterium]|uniref:Acetyl esterase n=4 Tax=Pseudomonadota TaxID=1224 RepID=A0ABQ4SQY8_9HYPH|nr:MULTISPECIES: alpha/beta hydrolase [Methylobacterium]PIU07847.1 MAG: lipase [Methylobacterium sp. CG09_land_8_20_14_0_10_71_15]PIU11046.1 MAG: lipase [Methylobacterium sp. CG08_land_8_20_14_0_20_71_15]GBU16007.1 carboxylesterase NlhH [Methylobacterium sp.]GJE05639.1 Acetyl esterase [Methylobacterium jeotgali]
MRHHLRASLLACAFVLPTGTLALAQAPAQESPGQAKPTLKDRLDAAVSTVTGSPMARLDVDMKHVLDAMKKLDPKPIAKLSPEEARRQPSAADGVRAYLEEQGKSAAPLPGVATKEAAYETAGGTQPVRIYTPDGASGPLPVVVYYHGGGFVIADRDVYDATPRAIAKGANAVVVSVEYRHAPEAKFPAQHEDALAAYQWALANAASFGGDPARVALLGESAGGNLATNIAIQARDGKAAAPLHVVAVYPMAGTNLDTESYKANTSTKPLDRDTMAWFYDHVVSQDSDRADPRLDIVGKADLKNLPPFTVVTAEIDPLRDDGKGLAEKLKAAGVTVEHRDYAGVTHEFFGMGTVVAKARQAEDAVVADLKKAFAGTATGTAAPAR